MENNEITDADLKAVSGFLRQQVAFCHEMTSGVRDTFFRETNRDAQEQTLKMMMKLVGATAVAAGAMSRIKGMEINQTITVLRAQAREGLPSEASRKVSVTDSTLGAKEGASPENAKTNSEAGGGPSENTKTNGGGPH